MVYPQLFSCTRARCLIQAIATALLLTVLSACVFSENDRNVHVTVSNLTGEPLGRLVISLNEENCAVHRLLPEGYLQCEFSKAGGGFSLVAVTRSKKRMILKGIGHSKAGSAYHHSIKLKPDGTAEFGVKHVIY